MKNSNVSNLSNLRSPKSPYKFKKSVKSPKCMRQKSPHLKKVKFNPVSAINSSESKVDEGSQEYIKCIQVALKDALKQNEKLKQLMDKLMNKKNKLLEEIEKKDDAILDMNNYYKFCQDNHNEKESENSLKPVKTERSQSVIEEDRPNKKGMLRTKRKRTTSNIINKDNE